MERNLNIPDQEMIIDVNVSFESVMVKGEKDRVMVKNYIAKTNFGRFFERSTLSTDPIQDTGWTEISLPDISGGKDEETREP